MEMVGRFTEEDQWIAECALECYRASRNMHELPFEEYKILDELYARITKTRVKHEELHHVMVFWARLDAYRERERHRMLQSSEDQTVRPKQASHILQNFKNYELCYDLAKSQRQSKGWRSTLQDARIQLKPSWNMGCQSFRHQLNLMMLQSTSMPLDNLHAIWWNGYMA